MVKQKLKKKNLFFRKYIEHCMKLILFLFISYWLIPRWTKLQTNNYIVVNHFFFFFVFESLPNRLKGFFFNSSVWYEDKRLMKRVKNINNLNSYLKLWVL